MFCLRTDSVTDSVISFVTGCIVSYQVTILGIATVLPEGSFFNGMDCHISLK